MRWVLLLLALGGVYWLYENGYYDTSTPKSRPAETATSEPLKPGPRPGGGLNPFYMDNDSPPPQRPHVP